MSAIPLDAQSITSSWLDETLGWPFVRCTLAESHSGTTGRAAFELEYSSQGNYPQRIFVKLPPTDDGQKKFVQATGMGRREAMFYERLASKVPVRVPGCYHTSYNVNGTRYVMVLEHLEDSGCSFRMQSKHYTLDYIRSVLSAFARLHARYWQSSLFATTLDWLQPPLQYDFTKQLIQRALSQYGCTMPSVFTAMGELYLADTDRIHQLWREGPQTLIHGDVHDGNMFFDGKQPGFLDWALVAKGPGMRDVAYFLAGALAAGDQALHSEALLDYYREQLSGHGIAAPSLGELWCNYQWHAAYVWVGAAATLSMGDAWQPVSYVTATLERLHVALEALDTVDSIREAIR